MPDPQVEPIIRVLYIDDDSALVRLVQKALGRRGFDVLHAANADEALSQIAAGGVDVIALDHYLTSTTGLDFLSQLGVLANAPAVVYVTGTSEMSVAVAALKAGAIDFVPKTVGDDFVTLLGASLKQAVDKVRLKLQKEAAEREVRVARDRAEVLLSEVNHRVANSLALLASLVSLQANAVKDEIAKNALEETKDRIFAISLVHKRLYTSGDVRWVELNEYLPALLEHLKLAMRNDGHGVALIYDIEPVKLQTDASINLGVVVTEWVTNAFKYAYPHKAGEIRVRLRLSSSNRAEVTVEDDGVGKKEDGRVNGTGLGTKIVKAMALNMGAETEYLQRQVGTTARLSFTLQPDLTPNEM